MPHAAKITLFYEDSEWDKKLAIVARTSLVYVSWSTDKSCVLGMFLAGHIAVMVAHLVTEMITTCSLMINY